jgi:hypothetical protein
VEDEDVARLQMAREVDRVPGEIAPAAMRDALMLTVAPRELTNGSAACRLARPSARSTTDSNPAAAIAVAQPRGPR